MKTIVKAAAALLWAAALAPLQAQDLPKWLTDAQAREAPLAAPAAVASEDGWLQARVPGGVRHKVVLESGGYSLSVVVGDALTVSCEVLRGSRDLAALLAETAEITFGQLRKANGEIEARTVEMVDAGAVDGRPYLALRWLYRARREGDVRVGGLKQFAADFGDAVVYCANDELGYVKTFDSIARTLVGGLRIEGQPVDRGHFGEVSVVSIDGQPVGVARTTLKRDADGDTQVVNKGAILVQTTPGQLMWQDTVEVQWVRPDGSLINALQVKAEQGKLSEDVRLRRGDDGRWRAAGTLAGKPVDFDLGGAPNSFVTLALARRQLMARAEPVGAVSEGTTWSSLDLSRLLPTRATVLAAAGADAYAVREEMGGMVIEAVLDRSTGTMASARLPIGARTMLLQRVHRHGSF